jgi:uncharacterized protein YneF (UPF0154 family)
MEYEFTTASAVGPASRTVKMCGKTILCIVAGLAIGYVSRGLVSPELLSKPPASAGQISTVGSAIGNQAIRGLRQSITSPMQSAVPVGHPAGPVAAMGGGHIPSLADMTRLADRQAAPILEKLKSDPNNGVLLAQVAAVYHTTHQFGDAVTYYHKAVQTDPKNVGLRTKLASSLYRSGDVDGAIAQLHKGLSYEPKDPNSLFNLGMIKLQGKQDGEGALAAWQQLLKSNPQLNSDRKATVEKLMADVLTTLGDQGGIKGERSNDGNK